MSVFLFHMSQGWAQLARSHNVLHIRVIKIVHLIVFCCMLCVLTGNKYVFGESLKLIKYDKNCLCSYLLSTNGTLSSCCLHHVTGTGYPQYTENAHKTFPTGLF